MLPELAAWLILFGVISVIYRLIPRQHADHLEGFLQYCKNFQSLVPIGIIIGFYVTTMYGRWWAQWKEIPWIGKAAMLVHDVDNRDSLEGYLSRWTYLRWTLLGMAMTFQYCSKHFRES